MQKLLFAEKVLKQYHFKEKTGKLTNFSASHASLDWKVDAVYSKLLAAAFYPSFQKKLTYMASKTFRVSFSVEMDTTFAVFRQKQSFWLFECPCKTRQNSNVHWLKVFEIPPIMAFRANSAIAQWKSHVMNIMDSEKTMGGGKYFLILTSHEAYTWFAKLGTCHFRRSMICQFGWIYCFPKSIP